MGKCRWPVLRTSVKHSPKCFLSLCESFCLSFVQHSVIHPQVNATKWSEDGFEGHSIKSHSKGSQNIRPFFPAVVATRRSIQHRFAGKSYKSYPDPTFPRPSQHIKASNVFTNFHFDPTSRTDPTKPTLHRGRATTFGPPTPSHRVCATASPGAC